MKKLIYLFIAIIVLLVVVIMYNQLKLKEIDIELGSNYLLAPGIKMAALSESTAGESSAVFELDHKYRQPHQFIVYYGELKYSGIPDYSVYDLMVVLDNDKETVAKVRAQGTKIFQYVYFGSRYDNTDEFLEITKNTIKSFKDEGLADGIFLDESDVAYWDNSDLQDSVKQQLFYEDLKEITDYIRSLGMESIINGTRSFAELGDYFLWESYLSYWSTNQVKWDSTTSLTRQLASNGAATYGSRFNNWKFEGTTHVKNGKVIGGEKGAMEIIVDLDKMTELEDRSDPNEWGYLEWLGQGGSDETVSIWTWTGNSLPFDESSWTKLPKLWKGEARSWNGINQTSKYVKLRFEFAGAKDLMMEQVRLTFNYNYPYWNMDESNGDADTNPYDWNYNNSQLRYLREQTRSDGSPVKVLTHSYGESTDLDRIKYTFLGLAIHGLYSWNFVHPLMQTVHYPEILEEPLGMLLRREEAGDAVTGYFTGGTASINTAKHTYSLDREEPSYFFGQAIAIDGSTTDWKQSDKLYDERNTNGVWVTDDKNNLYIKVKVAGGIHFNTDESVEQDYYYHIYLDTNVNDKAGYKGSWWETPATSAKFRLTNNGLYKWDSNTQDPRSNNGWEWIGTDKVLYQLNEAGDEIEYQIKKSELGNLPAQQLKLYVIAEDAKTHQAIFIKPEGWDGKTFTGEMTYTQKVFNPYVPHGYIQSQEIEVNAGRTAVLSWKEEGVQVMENDASTVESPEVKGWIRRKTTGNEGWDDWVEVDNGQELKGNFDRIQYSVGLYTDSGIYSPKVSNVHLKIKVKK